MEPLMFVLEEGGDPAQAHEEASDCLLPAHLHYLLKPLTPFQDQVLRDAQTACTSLCSYSGSTNSSWDSPISSPTSAAPSCSLSALAATLAAHGHRVALRQARGGSVGVGPAGAPTAYFSSLSHTFLVVASPAAGPFQLPSLAPLSQPGSPAAGAFPAGAFPAAAGSSCGSPLALPRAGSLPATSLTHCGVCRGGCGSELIVDPSFRCQFLVPRCSPRYQSLVDLLPPLFVGPACQLEHLVDWVSRELVWSFKHMGESPPPWRRKAGMLSKWLPRVATDTAVGAPSAPALPAPIRTLSFSRAPVAPAPRGAGPLAGGAKGGAQRGAGGDVLAVAPAAPATPHQQLPGQPRIHVVRMRGQPPQQQEQEAQLLPWGCSPPAAQPAIAAASPITGPQAAQLGGASLELAPAAGDSGRGSSRGSECLGSSPDSPTNWGCCCSSPLSVLQSALPMACAGPSSAQRGANACGKPTAAALCRQRGAGGASLLTRQLLAQQAVLQLVGV